MSHTPGPWIVDLGPMGEVTVCDEEGVSMFRFDGYDDAEEDANLAAAAPKMLKALEVAVTTIKALHGPVAWDLYVGNAPEMKTIISAIAKAKGAND